MATTFSVSKDEIIYNQDTKNMACRVITMSFVDDTAGDDPALTLSGKTWTGQGSTGTLAASILGWFLHSVHIIPGATGPTGDSDLTIISPSTGGPDLLNGSGTNEVDNATSSIVYPWDKASGSAVEAAIFSSIKVGVANNSVNNGAATIKLILISPPKD